MNPINIAAEALADQQNDLSDCPWYQRCLGNNEDGTCNRGCYDEPQCETCIPSDDGWPREQLAKRYAHLLPGGDEPFGPSDSHVIDGAAVLEALHDEGWRIVRAETVEASTDDGPEWLARVTEEWTPEVAP